MSVLVEVGLQHLGVDEAGKRRLVDYYNEHCVGLVKPSRRYRMKMTDQWCAMFTSVVAHQCGLGVDRFPYEVSVLEQYKIALERGQYRQGLAGVYPGDLVIYHWPTGRGFDHVGIVSEVLGDRIKVLEGNYRKTVGIRTVPRSSKSAVGYIELGRIAADDRISVLAKQVIAGRYGSGDDRRKALGDDYDAVQARVNMMLK